MFTSSNGVDGWDVLNPSECHSDEYDPLEELLSEETLANIQSKRQGESEDFKELAQLLADWEAQRVCPELSGIRHQVKRDSHAIHCEYEVIRSEVTHRVYAGAGSEYRVTQTIQQRTVRWEEAATEHKCLFDNGESLSNLGTSTATCRTPGLQQAPPDPARGDQSWHHLAERPVGGHPEIDEGECGSLNVNYNLKTCCDTSEGVIGYELRPPLGLSQSDPLLSTAYFKALRDNCSGYEANSGSAVYQKRS